MPRHFRRRTSMMRPVIRSYKKVLNIAPASRAAAATISDPLVTGTDSISPGQTTVTDATVPTGAIVKFIEIHYCATNLVAISHFQSLTIQHLHSGQTGISPLVVGGNPIRNQVHLQMHWSIGQFQNSTRVIKFKIPKRFQRVREGDSWNLVRLGSAVYADSVLVIYKFYT